MILRKTLLYIPAGTIGPLVQLATILVLTHWLAPADIGIYAIIVALQDLAQIVTLSWWSQYVLRYLEEQQPDIRRRQNRTELGVLLVSAVLQTVVIAGLMAVAGVENGGFWLFVSAALAGIARALVTHWSVRARAAQAIGLHALAQIAGPGLSLALALLGFLLVSTSLVILFLAVAVGHALVAVVMMLRLAVSGDGCAVDRTMLGEALRYGVFTTIGMALAWVSMQSVRFITDAMLGAAAVGLLHVGWGVGQRIATQIAVLGTSALFPVAASQSRAGDQAAGIRHMMLAGPILFAILTPATIGLAFVAAPVARLLTAPEFHDATATILPYAMLAGAVRVFRNHYLDDMLQLTGQPRLMTRLDALEAGATLLFCAYGVAWHGLLGGIIGCLVATVLTTAVAAVLIARRYGPPVPLRNLIVTSVAAAVMAGVLRLMPSPDGLASLVLVIAVAGAAYVLSFAAIEYRALVALARSGAAKV